MILHRPMFRKGGSAGEGITSGLRSGYKRGRVVNPGGYNGDPRLDPRNLLKGYPAFKKEYEAQVGPRSRSTNFNDFLISFGLDIASRPPQGGLLSTAAMSAKDPFEKFQQRKAYEQEAPREEERDLVKAYMSARGEALSGGTEQDMFSKEQQSGAIAGFTDELFKLTDDLAAGTITQEEHDRKKQTIYNKLGPYMKDNPAIEALYKVPDYADNAYREIKSMILSEESAIGGADYLGRDGKSVIEDGVTITVAEWFSRDENLAELRKKATKMYLQEAQDLNVGAITGFKAKGGRVGYQGGELVEQEDVNIMTPQGDVNMQETVEEEVEPDQLSYQELRSRLPVEITDDIIRLMVNSPEALTDFAQIQTQQDVDNFNAKYGVNLVLPSEA